ncbi:MAG: hypothetical protein WB660_31385 [Candidatus Sulfotelmatobacter sp.]
MKYPQCLALFTIMALSLSLSAFAADSHSGKFTLTDTVQVGSTELTPGNYKAEWSGPTGAVKIDILKNGKTVATAEGKIRDLQRPSPYDSVTVKALANDTKAIDEIDFSNHTQALVLAGE